MNYDRFSCCTRNEVSARSASFTTCAFLSTESIKNIIFQHSSVAEQVYEERKSIELNLLRPYPLDYFIPETKTKFNRCFMLSKRDVLMHRSYSV